MLLRLAALGTLALALAACGGGDDGGDEQPASSLPPGCEVPVIERAVNAYFAAVTAGDRAAIGRRLSPADDFVRLTVLDADGRRFTTASRAKAIAYLVGRHEQDQRERLLRLVVARGADANHVSVQGVVSRTALDFRMRGIASRVSRFDGAVNCVDESITRWRVLAV